VKPLELRRVNVNVLSILNTTHSKYSEYDTKILYPMIEAFTEPKERVHCAENYDHSFPHGGHPEHIPVTKTSHEEKEDRGVSEYAENEMQEHLVPCKLLKI
jgi:hypothetical protein